MKIKRRVFVENFIKLSASSIILSSTFASSSLFNLRKTNKSCHLKRNDCLEVKPNQKISLPVNPVHGDSVFIAINGDSLDQPASIKYDGHPILGDKEDLILDSLANLKLTYKSNAGWLLS
tara:strand:- start:70168 stop:70527 length:360 start_codon:yes stop_codon:yes gene_type:complete